MNNKLYPSLISGFGAAVFISIPGAKTFACCLFVPIAAAVSLYLYRRSTNDKERLSTGTGLMFGLITGLFAALFGTGLEVLITFLTKTNELVANLPQTETILRQMNLGEAGEQSLALLKEMAKEIQQKGFSPLLFTVIFITNLISFVIFGLIGGGVATAIINSRVKNS